MTLFKTNPKAYHRQWRRNNREKVAAYTRKCRFDGSKTCLDCGEVIGRIATRCNSCNKKGSRSSHWKGGITPLGLRIGGSREYVKWKLAILTRDNNQCQECGEIIEVVVHHNKYSLKYLMRDFLGEYNQFSPLEEVDILVRLASKYKPFWDINNGITLCTDCHKKEHCKR